ncbi:MAG: hypothetical protein HYX75_18615 [Acidobacteria bacterium]|nr:hypothetical protein [Acidobacteriota bacterium]
MMRTTGIVLLAACGFLVLYAEGLHWFVLWNLFPLFVAGMVIVRGTGAGGTSWAALVFASVTALAVAFVHLAWVFDWGATRTGSSTAALIFLFSPAYALLLGGCGWVAAKTVERFSR